jgi:hypothetical protein
MTCRRAGAGVNEKNFENQKRRLRLSSERRHYFFRFSCLLQSGLKHTAGKSFSLVRFFWTGKRNERIHYAVQKEQEKF